MALWEAKVATLRWSVQLKFGQNKTMKNTVIGENSRFGSYNLFVFSVVSVLNWNAIRSVFFTSSFYQFLFRNSNRN